MNKAFGLGLVLLVGLPLQHASASGWRKEDTSINFLNRKLRGKVLDFTGNHGVDNRIWSRSLYQRRDLYVYVPPQYDRNQRYPVMLLLHGFAQDESLLLTMAPILDDAINSGALPPIIVACPDGSTRGQASFLAPGSFFVNSNAGDYEDFVLCDVWDFLTRNFPIHEAREAHVLAGVSMGGFGAFSLGIRHRNAFGIVVGFFPPLNLRWANDRGDYTSHFDPHHWGWRVALDPNEVVARFGPVTMRMHHLIGPLFGTDDDALVEISRYNPIELLDRTRLRNGELSMYVGYAANDEFNIDAQVESFLYFCRYRGISVAVGYDVEGHHNLLTATRLMPGMFRWLAPQIARFSPPLDPCYREAPKDRAIVPPCPHPPGERAPRPKPCPPCPVCPPASACPPCPPAPVPACPPETHTCPRCPPSTVACPRGGRIGRPGMAPCATCTPETSPPVPAVASPATADSVPPPPSSSPEESKRSP